MKNNLYTKLFHLLKYQWESAVRQNCTKCKQEPDSTTICVNLNYENNKCKILVNNKGYIAFTSLLIISLVALSIAFSISMLGIEEVKTALGFKKGQETQDIAESCIEEGLLRLKNDNTYTGTSQPLNVGGGSCTIIVSGTNPNYTIFATAAINGHPTYNKKIQVKTKRGAGSVTITSWQEIK